MPPRLNTVNIWRQWERFTISGIRINNKRYTATQGLLTWLLLLIGLYVLRLLAKNSSDWDDDDWSNDLSVSFWKDRHLIFCISPGRSGSLHVHNVLDAASETRSFHEPEPKMTGSVFQSVFLKGKREETFETRSALKLGAIRKQLEGTSSNVVYAETSHMFIKTFADIILQLGDIANITIISLHRPLNQIVLSQLHLGWFSPNHSGHHEWYYDVSEVHESERVLPLGLKFTTAVDRCIAYNADILQRGEDLRHDVHEMQQAGRWENVHFVDVNITHLSSPSNVRLFLNTLGLGVDQRRLQLLSNQDDNQRETKKDRVQSVITIEEVAQRIKKLHDGFKPLPEQ